jgi:hypothetical protein
MTVAATRGRYTYVCDGRPVPVDETFAVVPQTRGLLVSCARTAPGTSMLVDVVHGPQTEATFTWTSELAATAAHAQVVHTWDGAHLHAHGTVEGVGAFDETVAAPGASYFPLMRVFSGRTLLRLIDAGADGVDVMTPDIRDPKELDRWLRPLLDHRRVGAVDDTTLDVDGAVRPCRVVEYLGGSYDAPARVWVDDGGLLLRYTWEQPGVGDWDVRVEQIDGDWPRPVEW